MRKKKILLMYISRNSGHHRAACAIEQAIKLNNRDHETLAVDGINYTNPVLGRIVNKTYMGVIRTRPEFWGYLYDNPTIVRKIQRLRELIHNYNSSKLTTLIENFRPDAVICTQAFPCGMVADLKKSKNVGVGLYGVLTDYAPHSYWIFGNVNAYFVPSKETGEKLARNGVPSHKIIDTGIPIDPRFRTAKERTALIEKFGYRHDQPIVLIMGGSQGVGPLREAYLSLLQVTKPIQIVAITGANRGLFHWFKRQVARAGRFGKQLTVHSYTSAIDELMEIATVLISKPGGITTAEACAKGLPLVILQPIPGQEEMNANYLMKHAVAVKVNRPQEAGVIAEEMLFNRGSLEDISIRARSFARPESAQNIADFVLANCEEREHVLSV